MEMVILSTSEAISDLLDQRSSIYSDKVRVPQPTHLKWDPVADRAFTSHLPQWLNCKPLRQIAFHRPDLFSRTTQDRIH